MDSSGTAGRAAQNNGKELCDYGFFGVVETQFHLSLERRAQGGGLVQGKGSLLYAPHLATGGFEGAQPVRMTRTLCLMIATGRTRIVRPSQ